MPYTPPMDDLRFILTHIAPPQGIEPDLRDAVLQEAAKLAADVWAGTNRAGDKFGAKLENGAVQTAPGFKDAYLQYAQGGWVGLTSDPAFGGQGLPHSLAMAVNEMFQSANLALSLCPMLSQAAIEAIQKYGTDEQKQTYLPNLISGTWTGTMHLTEPQAGTDLAAIRTTARKNGDHYLMKGQKIFITFGEHDFTENIIHLVLARVDGLPEGNEGLGLFIVPKFLQDGTRNDVYAVSLEHKLGIHGSPTCVMSYGDHQGAVAYLLGREGEGLKNMFTMMNNARIGVGLQGVAACSASYQHALAYARERVQGTKLGDKSGARTAIIAHPDVRRMLMTMKATTEAARALALLAGHEIDRMKAGEADAAARVDLLTPLVKAWPTDLAVENASLGVQVHGGMGFIEETGAAQYYRDARILPIYEGTNGIQSNDLTFRKVLRDGGAEAKKLFAEIRGVAADLPGLEAALADLERATDWILAKGKEDMALAASSAAPYLRLFAVTAGGWLMARMARAAAGGESDFNKAKTATARFYAEAILPQTRSLAAIVQGGNASAVAAEDAWF